MSGTGRKGIVRHSRRIKIGAGVGALVLAIATPVALAQVGGDHDGDALDAGADGLICFEVEDHFGGPFALEGGPMFEGGFPFDGMPGEGFGFEGEWPFGLDDGEFEFEFEFEGEWPPEFGDGEFFSGFEFDGEFAPEMEEMLDLVNEESMALAEHLEQAGIDHEVVTGPMGMIWVEWDFSDPAANQAVEEFIAERGGLIEMAAGILPLDGFLDGLPFDLDEIPFGFEDMPFDLEGLGGLFLDVLPWDHGEALPLFPEGPGWGGEFPEEMMFDGPFGRGTMCVETIDAQAERISADAAGLAEALAAAGIDVTIETRQISVPVWDTGDEAANEVVEQYYSGLFGFGIGSDDGS